MTVEHEFRSALALHGAGRLAEAEYQCRQILARMPEHAETLNLLAVVLVGSGRPDPALALIDTALRVKPGYWEAMFNRGLALDQLGRLDEAVTAYEVAARRQPDQSLPWLNLGVVLCKLGETVRAAEAFRKAIARNPQDARAQHNLATLLIVRREFAEAEQCLRQSLRFGPLVGSTHATMAKLMLESYRYQEAETFCYLALALDPRLLDARLTLALACCRLGRFDEAIEHLKTVVMADPSHVDGWNNLGLTLHWSGRPADAIDTYRKALAIAPDAPGTHQNLALALLTAGAFTEGWAEFEWRWKVPGFEPLIKDLSAPVWDGAPLGDRSLLVYAEQGLGDTIQFSRYLPRIAATGRLFVAVQEPLRPLLAGMPGLADVVSLDDPLPPHDLRCPIATLPALAGTTATTIPGMVPYLFADPERAARWRRRLDALRGLRVGIVWAGNPKGPSDDRRSTRLEDWRPLAAVEGVTFVSLQVGTAARQARDPDCPVSVVDWTHDLTDFAETAALVSGLDLVIGVDTAVIHLAGALGRPTWLLNRFDTDWRWQLGREDSPWYPTLRQFRQTAVGIWEDVMSSAATVLTERVRAVTKAALSAEDEA